MTTRRRRGEDGISFEHRGPCRDPHRHRNCPGLWRGEITTGYTGDGRRTRRKVSGTTKAAVIDKLRDLRTQLDTGITPKPGYAHYTVRQAAEDWLASGLDGRSPKTVTKNRNVLAPLLKVIGARKLRDLSAADVRQALAAMAAGYSTAAVSMGHLALKRAIRHAEASNLVTRNVAALADTPKGREGRPSGVADPGPGRGRHGRCPDPAGDGTAARPQRRPPPGGADARLHRAEPAVRAAHRRSPRIALGARRPGRRPGRPPSRPAACGRVAIGPRPRRDQDRAVPPHPRPPRRRGPGTARLDRTARPANGTRPGTTGRTPGWCSPATWAPRWTRGTSGRCSSASAPRRVSGTAGPRASCAPRSSA